MSDLKRMKELVQLLDDAARAYYQESRELMSNLEYDKLYDELTALETKLGTVLAKSPTAKPGYEVLSELPKEEHRTPMLSLDKTKEVQALVDFLGEQDGVLSWKLDGLTVVLTYQGGKLVKAITRGNGSIGEVVTSNARTFVNLPLQIPFQGELVLRGEAIITYSDFEQMNEKIDDVDAKYKNPRNLCAGSVRQLNSEITANRKVNLVAFSLIQAEGVDFFNSRIRQFEWLKEQGFSVVDYRMVNAESVSDAVQAFAEEIKTYDIPSDGLVLLLDDIAYGESLGQTAKFPRNALAFKWQDEQAETTLNAIEWSPSRTGLINPVAIFEPVELEGTTVSRASVHNISVMEELELGVGDRITVYKANMIIPQIADNLSRSNSLCIPKVCPACGEPTKIRSSNEVKTLICTNADCVVKKVKSFELFVSRNALNIEGMSGATLEKLTGKGMIKEFADLFLLERYREEIVALEGFGEKSYEKMIQAAKRASNTTLPRLIFGLGIPGIGAANAKLLCKTFGYDIERLRHADAQELILVEGIGSVLADGWVLYFSDESNQKQLDHLLAELTIEVEESDAKPVFDGVNFVVTGSVEHFANRNELKAYIEARGGKVVGSVSAKTNYLINNDTTSNSAKNKKAKELGIPILSEAMFLELNEEG